MNEPISKLTSFPLNNYPNHPEMKYIGIPKFYLKTIKIIEYEN